MTAFEGLLAALDRQGVEYIVVGGAAALAHGSARFTQDLDIVYSRSADNLTPQPGATYRSFAGTEAYPGWAPPGLPLPLGSSDVDERAELHA